MKEQRPPKRSGDALPPLRCPSCEMPTAARKLLGVIRSDGVLAEASGVACGRCGFLAVDEGAPEMPIGHVDLHGKRPAAWFYDALTAVGCRPMPRDDGSVDAADLLARLDEEGSSQ